jgi:hypothetical protein
LQVDVTYNTYGTISKDSKTGGAEVDRLLYEPRNRRLTIVSAKRDRKKQQLNSSFLDHVEKVCESMPPLLEHILPLVQKLRLVAVSARPRGSPSSLSAQNLRNSKMRFDEKSGKFLLDVSLKKQPDKKKPAESKGSGVQSTWEVEARDLMFSDLLESIPTDYPACAAVLVI